MASQSTAREPVSGIPSWACGHARSADLNIPPGEGEFGKVEGVDAGCRHGLFIRLCRVACRVLHARSSRHPIARLHRPRVSPALNRN